MIPGGLRGALVVALGGEGDCIAAETGTCDGEGRLPPLDQHWELCAMINCSLWLLKYV